jgi:hypothetical protein
MPAKKPSSSGSEGSRSGRAGRPGPAGAANRSRKAKPIAMSHAKPGNRASGTSGSAAGIIRYSQLSSPQIATKIPSGDPCRHELHDRSRDGDARYQKAGWHREAGATQRLNQPVQRAQHPMVQSSVTEIRERSRCGRRPDMIH